MNNRFRQESESNAEDHISHALGYDRNRSFLSLKWRLLPGVVMALVIGLLFQLGACQPLEHLFYDALFQLRGPMDWGSQVAVIEIDEPSIQKFGRFPWKRDRYAELLTVLTDAQASVVGLDLLMPEPAPEDQALAAAMTTHGRVVLVQDWTQSGMALDPSPPLQAAAIATGHVYKREDPDGLTRSLELYRHDLPSLALVLAQLYSSPNLPVDFPNPTQPLWLNWFGPTTEAARFSFAQVLARQVPLKEFRNKIVLVGTNALALDSLQTPYDRNPPTGKVYLHATAVNNILRANALQQPSAGWLVLIWLLGGPGLSVLLARWRFERQILTWLGLAAGWFCVSLLLFYAGWWVPTAMPIALILGTGMAAAFIDQYHTNRLLQQSEERYALAVYGSNEGLWDWNLRTDQLYLSPRWKEMLGYGPSEVGDRIEAWFSRVHSEDLDSLKAAIDDHIHGSTPHFEHEHRIAHHNGSYRWVMSRGIAVRDRNGQTYRLAGSQTDITERREAEDKLRRIALYDELTSLPNRAFFLDTIAKAIAQSNFQLFNTYAVLLLDIDRFQVVNSSLGNTVGDQLLVAIAYRLKAFIPADGVVARLGGDEFAIYINHAEHVSDAIRAADQIQRLLSLPFNLDGHEVFTSVSIGIALSAAHYNQPEHLLRDADTAMYRAKALGKARYQIFDKTMHTRMVARLQLENDLRRAINQEERYTEAHHPDANELQLHYQPIVELVSGQIAGFEALVRWQHPDLGFLSPAKFISMAEETGLIIPLGWWILRQACRQMQQWEAILSADTPLTINVNLASKQFSLPDLTEQIHYILANTGIQPSRLKLEITESTIMDNASSVIDTLKQLRAIGIQLAIDDFGIGYSSLSYLRRFPINTLKIDRSFVSRMIDSNSAEIVKTIVTLAHNLGMDVTAEGVESADQSAHLLSMNCEYGQGYLFSKPLDAEAATELLKEQPWIYSKRCQT